eukprot:CAMPEP_0118701374 /NCGR_PEP_ID=MMETSP0800-20121206/17212_1 /TAXON_ID=210618 ORGANISM="Striatella unipunctata, Strain CCMP2910" /NCGR_SAMPLE_ID=MMETSP0800 /ASSEMBLY_ACC=CAM_ASM_000638 /LENGTH=187 /DNA_ID=CAMNT_0006602281 /DNA_START=97 /DNA_END=660 /DNA_ORIENTATION=-
MDDLSPPKYDSSDETCSSPVTPYPELGIAHLVLFGNDEGITTLELPVKKNPSWKRNKSENKHGLSLEPDALIRIRVEVLPSGGSNGLHSPRTPRTTYFPSFSIPSQLSREELSPYLGRAKMPLMNMECSARDSLEGLKGPMLCGARIEWSQIVLSLSGLVRTCEEDGYIQTGDSLASTIDTAASLDI